jgi:hypothetical protein
MLAEGEDVSRLVSSAEDNAIVPWPGVARDPGQNSAPETVRKTVFVIPFSLQSVPILYGTKVLLGV